MARLAGAIVTYRFSDTSGARLALMAGIATKLKIFGGGS